MRERERALKGSQGRGHNSDKVPLPQQSKASNLVLEFGSHARLAHLFTNSTDRRLLKGFLGKKERSVATEETALSQIALSHQEKLGTGEEKRKQKIDP